MMAADITKGETEVTFVRELPVAQDRVWAAWTDPKRMGEWFAPMPTWGCRVERADLREGGAYALEMIEPDGTVHRAEGVYRRIESPRRLAFTWKWSAEPDDAEPSLVEITLEPSAQGTRLTLKHTRLGSRERVEEHAAGWTGCLARLEALLSPDGSENEQ